MKKISIASVAAIALLLALFFQLREQKPQIEALPVGRVASRDQIVTIFTEGDRNLYSITSRSGEVLGEFLDESALEAEFPAIHKQIKTGIANIWAGMDLPNSSNSIRSIERARSIETAPMIPSSR